MPPLDPTAPAACPLPRSLAHSLPRVEPAALLIIATAAGLTLLWWLIGGWTFPLDDAYITLHNARVLIEGHDPNYGVSALIGATSLIHLALITVASLLWPPELASYLVSCAGVTMFLAGLLALGRRQGLTPTETAALAFAGMMTSASLLLNGLETGLALAGITWALVLASGAPSRRLALLCGTLPFLRPEIGLLSIALMGRQAWLRWQTVPDGRKAAVAIRCDGALAFAAAVPWLAWSLAETGAVLPATISAKQAFFGFETHTPLVGLLMALTYVTSALGPMVAALAFVRRHSLALVLWAFVGLFILGYGLTVPEILVSNQKRYAAVLVPVALLALASLATRPERKLLHILLVAQGVSCAVLFAMAVPRLSGDQARVRSHRAVSTWAQTHLPAGSRLLIHDAGMIAYASDLPLADLVGLKSPDSVADHRRWTQPTEGRERFRALDAIARRDGATHAIILEDEPDRFWGRLADELRQAGWGVDRLDTPAGEGAYKLYRLTPPAPDALTPDRAPDSAGTRRPR